MSDFYLCRLYSLGIFIMNLDSLLYRLLTDYIVQARDIRHLKPRSNDGNTHFILKRFIE